MIISPSYTSAHPDRMYQWANETACAIGPRHLVAPYHGMGNQGAITDYQGNTKQIGSVTRCDSVDLLILKLADGESDLPSYFTLPSAYPSVDDALVVGGTGVQNDMTRAFKYATAKVSSTSPHSGAINVVASGAYPMPGFTSGDSGGPQTDSTETTLYALTSQLAGTLFAQTAWLKQRMLSASGPAVASHVFNTTSLQLHVTWDGPTTYAGSAGSILIRRGATYYRNVGSPLSGNGDSVHIYAMEVTTSRSQNADTIEFGAGLGTNGTSSQAVTGCPLCYSAAPTPVTVTFNESLLRGQIRFTEQSNYTGSAAGFKVRTVAGNQYKSIGAPITDGLRVVEFSMVADTATLDAGTASVADSLMTGATSALGNPAQITALTEGSLPMGSPTISSCLVDLSTSSASMTVALTFATAVDVAYGGFDTAGEGFTMKFGGMSFAGSTPTWSNSNKTATMTISHGDISAADIVGISGCEVRITAGSVQEAGGDPNLSDITATPTFTATASTNNPDDTVKSVQNAVSTATANARWRTFTPTKSGVGLFSRQWGTTAVSGSSIPFIVVNKATGVALAAPATSLDMLRCPGMVAGTDYLLGIYNKTGSTVSIGAAGTVVETGGGSSGGGGFRRR